MGHEGNDPRYEFLTEAEKVKLGAWCWVALQSVTGWFEQLRWFDKDQKGRPTTTYMVGLSEEGMRVRDVLQRVKDEGTTEAWPMVVKPSAGKTICVVVISTHQWIDGTPHHNNEQVMKAYGLSHRRQP